MKSSNDIEPDFSSLLSELCGEHECKNIQFLGIEVPRIFSGYGVSVGVYRFFCSLDNIDRVIVDFVEWDHNYAAPHALPHFFLDYEASQTLDASQYYLFFYSKDLTKFQLDRPVWVERLFGKIPCSVFSSVSKSAYWQQSPRLVRTNLRKVSIVTVVKNEVEFIEQTIQSVLYQNARDQIEYIVIDGFSDDGTIEIISEYQDVIDVLVSRTDESIYSAMNHGIDLCTGDLLLFLNGGDCLASPDSMSLLLESAVEVPVIAGLALNISEQGSWIRPSKRRRNKLKNFSHQAILMRPDFKFNEQYRIAADHELLRNITDFAVIPNIISFFRIGGASTGAISCVQIGERLRVHGYWGLVRLIGRWLVLKIFGNSAVNFLRKLSER